MAVAPCPECSQGIELHAALNEGARMKCPKCGAELEITNLAPLELDWAYYEPIRDWQSLDGEDWKVKGPDRSKEQ
jgi:lysine biosynthesis protein LysW